MMTKRTKKSLLKKLADAMIRTVGEDFEKPVIRDEPYMELGSGPALSWEGGPFEWTAISMGSSLFAGEFGKYSTPTEPRIQKVIDEIKERGGYLEAVTSWQIAINE